MAFDDADWGVGVEEKVNLAPTEEKGEIVIDINSPETITSQLRKGLNNTPTRLGFYDGTQWTNYFSSDGFFRVGTATNYIEYNPNTDITTFTGEIDGVRISEGSSLLIPTSDPDSAPSSLDFVSDTATLRVATASGSASLGVWGLTTNARVTLGGEITPPQVGTGWVISKTEGSSLYLFDTQCLFRNKLSTVTYDISGFGLTQESTLELTDSKCSLYFDTSGNLSRELGVDGSGINVSFEGGLFKDDISSTDEIINISETGIGINAKFDGTYDIVNPPPIYSTSERVSLNADTEGQLWLNDNTISADLRLVSTMVEVPPTSSSMGRKSQLSHDDNYLYICTATDTWKRIALSTW